MISEEMWNDHMEEIKRIRIALEEIVNPKPTTEIEMAIMPEYETAVEKQSKKRGRKRAKKE